MHRVALLALSLSALSACITDEPAGTDGSTGDVTTGAPAEPGAVFTGKVDVIDLCGVDGATTVSFRARKVGCVQAPPAPCTIKIDPYEEFVGDAAPCPASQTALDMQVTVPDPARYQVEARTLTASGFQSRCYGVKGEDVLLVTADQVEARAQIAVTSLAGTCPNP